MQLSDPTSSQTWADKILWMLGGGGIIGGLVALVNLILNRNKPKADIANSDAHTSLTQAETAVKLSNELTTLHDRMNLMEASVDQLHREAMEKERAHQAQLLYFEALDNANRNRCHAMAGEVGRLVLEIRALEAKCTEATGKAVDPLPLRTSEEILAPWPLPKVPD